MQTARQLAHQIVSRRGTTRINNSVMVPAVFPFKPYINLLKYADLIELAKRAEGTHKRFMLSLIMDYRTSFMLSSVRANA